MQPAMQSRHKPRTQADISSPSVPGPSHQQTVGPLLFLGCLIYSICSLLLLFLSCTHTCTKCCSTQSTLCRFSRDSFPFVSPTRLYCDFSVIAKVKVEIVWKCPVWPLSVRLPGLCSSYADLCNITIVLSFCRLLDSEHSVFPLPLVPFLPLHLVSCHL